MRVESRIPLSFFFHRPQINHLSREILSVVAYIISNIKQVQLIGSLLYLLSKSSISGGFIISADRETTINQGNKKEY